MASQLQFASLGLRPLAGYNSLMSDAEFLSNLEQNELIEVDEHNFLEERSPASFIESFKGTTQRDLNLTLFLKAWIEALQLKLQEELSAEGNLSLVERVHLLKEKDYEIIAKAYRGITILACNYLSKYTPRLTKKFQFSVKYYQNKIIMAKWLLQLANLYREKILSNQLNIPILSSQSQIKAKSEGSAPFVSQHLIREIQELDKRVTMNLRSITSLLES